MGICEDAILSFMQQEDYFHVKPELIEALERHFPMRDFNKDITLRDVDYHCGQRSVINFLKDRLEDQIENSLTSIEN